MWGGKIRSEIQKAISREIWWLEEDIIMDETTCMDLFADSEPLEVPVDCISCLDIGTASTWI